MMKKVLVIGDSCQDNFIYGTCNRLSPEAPIINHYSILFLEKFKFIDYNNCNSRKKTRYLYDGINNKI